LAEAAAEARAMEADIITQRIQERHLRIIGVDRHGLAIHV